MKVTSGRPSGWSAAALKRKVEEDEGPPEGWNGKPKTQVPLFDSMSMPVFPISPIMPVSRKPPPPAAGITLC